MFRRLAWQLTFSYIVVILFSMGILGFYMVKNLDEDYRHELQHSIRQQAQEVAGTWSAYLEDMHVTDREKRKLWQLAQRLAWQTGSRIVVFNHAHKVIVDTAENVNESVPSDAMMLGAFNGLEQFDAEPDPSDTRNPRFSIAFPIRVRRPNPKAPDGAEETVQGAVYVSRSTAYMHYTLHRLRALFLFGTAISLILSGTLSLFLSHFISQPLQEIADAAELVAGGDLSIEVPSSTGNEIGELGERFNFMTRQLRGSTSLLLEEKNKLDAVLTNMADGVLMLDTEGHAVIANPSAEQMLSWRTDGAGDLFEALVGPLAEALSSGEDTAREVPLAGGKIMRAIYSPVRSEAGEVLGMVVILHDITELRRLAELKTEFVSNVSHELKTPLASIKGLAEVLLDGALKEKDGERFLRSIGREVDRMARLVKDLLSLSKIESGVVKMEARPFDLPNLVRDVTGRLQPRGGPARFNLSLKGAEPMWALGDPDRVDQVLVNLLDNAMRYSPGDSTIEIRAARLEDVCQVDVQDQGVGIPADDLERIFERFYRVDKARTREQGGTGLGLSIARQIVDRLGGRIWATSDGHGSCFSFTLPTAQNDIIAAAEAGETTVVEAT